MLAAIVRKKFESPDADAISCGFSPDRMIWFNGMKKHGIARPIRNLGSTNCQNEVSAGNVENQYDVAPNTRNENVTTERNSKRWMLRPMIGAIRNARLPTGAV